METDKTFDITDLSLVQIVLIQTAALKLTEITHNPDHATLLRGIAMGIDKQINKR